MQLVAGVWQAIGGDPEILERLDARPAPTGALPSSFAVEAFGTAAFGAVGLAVAELMGASRATVDGSGVADALRSEQAVRVADEEPESVWDPLSRISRARDGWVRLHGNYAQHRRAIEASFGTDDPEAVAAAIHESSATGVETRVVAAGGAAAAAHTLDEWSAHPHGGRVGDHPLIDTTVRADGRPAWQPGPWHDGSGSPSTDDADRRPLAGLRVLELTRVVAGPVAGRTLSWFGADVLRIESPLHDELRTLTVDTGPDKRSATLDLRRPEDRARFEELVAGADVLLHGLRPGALDRLGYGPERRADLSPGLIDASHSAYGPGAWSTRRGFDSLMQLSTGLGLAEAEAAGALTDDPRPLPCQVLDHTTGLLVAAAVIRAVTARGGDGRGRTVQGSLARTAAQLAAAPRDASFDGARPTAPAPGALALSGAFGRTRHVPLPVTVDGVAGGWLRGPSAVGTDAAVWPRTAQLA
ncbi:MAG: CoA transferase [Solirubrobacteraceae bacterium]|nr:CoA transferase [Patulibacter sp.]